MQKISQFFDVSYPWIPVPAGEYDFPSNVPLFKFPILQQAFHLGACCELGHQCVAEPGSDQMTESFQARYVKLSYVSSPIRWA